MKKIVMILLALLYMPIFGSCTRIDNVNTSVTEINFNTSNLSKYKGVAVKEFTLTDSLETGNNNKNKEIIGTQSLGELLGRQNKEYKTQYIYMGDKTFEEDGNVKWYYYYPKSWKGRAQSKVKYQANYVMKAGKAGDTLVIAKKSDSEIVIIIAQKNAPQQKELLAFLSSGRPVKEKEEYDTAPAVLPIDNMLKKNFARVYFTPSTDCENNIIEQIKTAKTMDVAVYSITNDKIVNALVKAKTRGAKVRIITDRLQSKGRGSLVPRLEQEGFAIKTNIKHKIMHNKFAIFDDKEIESGSYNWTASASQSNAENCMFFKQNNKEFSDQFEYMWNFYDR